MHFGCQLVLLYLLYIFKTMFQNNENAWSAQLIANYLIVFLIITLFFCKQSELSLFKVLGSNFQA